MRIAGTYAEPASQASSPLPSRDLSVSSLLAALLHAASQTGRGAISVSNAKAKCKFIGGARARTSEAEAAAKTNNSLSPVESSESGSTEILERSRKCRSIFYNCCPHTLCSLARLASPRSPDRSPHRRGSMPEKSAASLSCHVQPWQHGGSYEQRPYWS